MKVIVVMMITIMMMVILIVIMAIMVMIMRKMITLIGTMIVMIIMILVIMMIIMLMVMMVIKHAFVIESEVFGGFSGVFSAPLLSSLDLILSYSSRGDVVFATDVSPEKGHDVTAQYYALPHCHFV